MAALLKGTMLAAGSALALLSSPAHAQLREASLQQIFESYNDCFAATETGTINAAALTSLGWSRATMTDGDGNSIKDGPIIFGHTDRNAIILLSALEGDGVCIVNARIASFDVFESFTEAFGGNLPEPDEQGAITYRAQGHIVQIAPTGSKEKPSLRLVVGTKSETN